MYTKSCAVCFVMLVMIVSGSYAAPYTIESNTTALWHCDAVDTSWGYARVLDATSAGQNWEVKSVAGGWDPAYAPAVEPGMSGMGNALRFDSSKNQMAKYSDGGLSTLR